MHHRQLKCFCDHEFDDDATILHRTKYTPIFNRSMKYTTAASNFTRGSRPPPPTGAKLAMVEVYLIAKNRHLT